MRTRAQHHREAQLTGYNEINQVLRKDVQRIFLSLLIAQYALEIVYARVIGCMSRRIETEHTTAMTFVQQKT